MQFICQPNRLLQLTYTLSSRLYFKQYSTTLYINLKPFNSRISSYMKNGFVQEAQNLFDEMSERNTVTYNIMVRGYFQNGQLKKALNLYDQLPEKDIFSHNTAIAGLMQFGDIIRARKVYESMVYRDVVTWNSMIAGFVQHGLVDDAVEVFEKMPVKNVISWNSVLSGLLSVGKIDLAKKLFGEMDVRDVVSWTTMMNGFLNAGLLVEARECFDDMPDRDILAWNTMINGYIKLGLIEIAMVLFHKMPERNWYTWNDMINGLLSNHRINDAMRIFTEMPEKCQKSWNSFFLGFIRNGLVKQAHAVLEKYPFSDVVSQTNMLIGYFDIDKPADALKLFELMPFRDTTAWNATVFGLGESDNGEDGIKLFIRMKTEQITVDEATFTSILMICSNLPSLDLGKQIHTQVIKTGIHYFTAVSNALVSMYARCGSMESSFLEFNSNPNQDIVSWNSIICGLACHGYGEDALKMFDKMSLTDIKPNHITFVGVLSACSRAGLVEQGRYYFSQMKNEYHIEPTNDHYTCIVDLLGRFGYIDESMNVLDQMRLENVAIESSVWGALLGACRIHKNYEMGRIAGEKILELEPLNSGVYMILTEMYLSCGKKFEAEKIWGRMRENGVKKQPGCSWVEVNSSGHVFLAGERSSHPEFFRICCVLELMHFELEVLNPRFDSSHGDDDEILLTGFYD